MWLIYVRMRRIIPGLLAIIPSSAKMPLKRSVATTPSDVMSIALEKSRSTLKRV